MVGKIVNYKHSIATKRRRKGYFEFGGSTVVLILKKETVKIDDDIINNSSENIETKSLLGQTIGHKSVKDVEGYSNYKSKGWYIEIKQRQALIYQLHLRR